MEINTLKKILREQSTSFTVDELQQMMNEELQKPSDEMDTDLIDLCLDALEKAEGDAETANVSLSAVKTQNRQKKKRIKIARALLIAAVIVALLVVAIPVSAKFVHTDASDKIVQYVNDRFQFDLRGNQSDANGHADESEALIAQLQEEGFDSVILPKDFLNSAYTFEVDIVQNDDDFCIATVNFESNANDNEEISGVIHITLYKTQDSKNLEGVGNMDEQYDSAKELTVNGMRVLVFGNADNSYIYYMDGDVDYSFVLSNCSFEQAIAIAQSVGTE